MGRFWRARLCVRCSCSMSRKTNSRSNEAHPLALPRKRASVLSPDSKLSGHGSVVVVPVVAIASFVGTWKLLDKGIEKPPLEGGWRGLAIAVLLTVGILLVGVLVAVVSLRIA